jgi:phage terminase small subunit
MQRQAVKFHERCMQEMSPITDRKGDRARDEAGNPLQAAGMFFA